MSICSRSTTEIPCKSRKLYGDRCPYNGLLRSTTASRFDSRRCFCALKPGRLTTHGSLKRNIIRKFSNRAAPGTYMSRGRCLVSQFGGSPLMTPASVLEAYESPHETKRPRRFRQPTGLVNKPTLGLAPRKSGDGLISHRRKKPRRAQMGYTSECTTGLWSRPLEQLLPAIARPDAIPDKGNENLEEMTIQAPLLPV